jgi:hypothetical protein
MTCEMLVAVIISVLFGVVACAMVFAKAHEREGKNRRSEFDESM